MHFKDCSDRRVWDRLFWLIVNNPNMETAMIDSVITRIHARSP